MRGHWEQIDPPWFDPDLADEMGLVGVGGTLTPPILLRAYSEGIFPWFNEGDPIYWWSPDPRAIFDLDEGMHISRRLARTIRSNQFQLTINRDFPGVMDGCADRPIEGTWITPEMRRAYVHLHQLGYAHSVEVWQHDHLVGGLYGVSVGGLFAGESMFHRVSNASKVALAFAIDLLRTQGYELFDIQMVTEHTESLGAIEIPRRDYLNRLHRALKKEATFQI
jgi:leucyl/phenylalanyl-tRNA--protein transferase